LDHSLEERNTIEMQAITALAHLRACVLFFIDISETCGQTIAQQVSLFNSIKPLFQNKPFLIVMTKIDLVRFETLSEEDKSLLLQVLNENNVSLITMSNKSGEGIQEVKEKACSILLEYRMQQKPEVLAGGSKTAKFDEEFLRGM
jgi:nucleolar GTP-binding protein